MSRRSGARTSGAVVWFEVIGQDGDKLRRFYQELLGWEFEMQPVKNYGVVQPGEGAPGIRGGVGQAGPGAQRWVTFYTQVPDLEAAIERARALGSRVLLAPTPVPDTTIAVVADPEGNPVGLCTPRR